MREKESLIRARALIRRGRYTKHTIKAPEPRFETMDSIDGIRLDDAEWMPYYDKSRNQVVYGYHEKRKKGHLFHYLAFLAFDYHYAANSPFDWVDDGSYGFQDLD